MAFVLSLIPCFCSSSFSVYLLGNRIPIVKDNMSGVQSGGFATLLVALCVCCCFISILYFVLKIILGVLT